MKKINIDESVETELTEREEKIYRKGCSDGWTNGVLFIICSLILIVAIVTFAVELFSF